ncbi:hypothetical protein Dimus_015976 [Dionaea muscipula]
MLANKEKKASRIGKENIVPLVRVQTLLVFNMVATLILGYVPLHEAPIPPSLQEFIDAVLVQDTGFTQNFDSLKDDT